MLTSYLHFSPREKEQVWSKVPSIMGDAQRAVGHTAWAAAGGSAQMATEAITGRAGWQAGVGGCTYPLTGLFRPSCQEPGIEGA